MLHRLTWGGGVMTYTAATTIGYHHTIVDVKPPPLAQLNILLQWANIHNIKNLELAKLALISGIMAALVTYFVGSKSNL